MQTKYTQKNDTLQKDSANTAESVVDSSSQSATLQRHASLANTAAQRAPEPRPNNTGMPDNLKAGIESLSGFSMDDVRVHYNSSKPATVQALAYTQGTDIHVAPGQEKHLPHEAWHVAQQMAGRVSPTTNINGMPVNDNAALEHEADVMGEKAVQCKMFDSNLANGIEQSSAIQRMAYAKENEDGTVSAETEQYEGNKELAEKFGRTVVDGDGKYKRPDEVARKVDQYKKEMLTYIASRIQDIAASEDNYYGPHISVVITRGIWFIAINSDYGGKQDEMQKNLRRYATVVKNEIKEKWFALQAFAEIEENKKFFKETESGTKGAVAPPALKPATIDEKIAKNQALYIAYRWAGKDNGIVVEQNELINRSKGVVHGEMQTLGFLNNKAYMLNYASDFFQKAIKAADCTTEFGTALNSVKNAADNAKAAADKVKVKADADNAKAAADKTKAAADNAKAAAEKKQKNAKAAADKAQKKAAAAAADAAEIAARKAEIAALEAEIAALNAADAADDAEVKAFEAEIAALNAADAADDAEVKAFEAALAADKAVKMARERLGGGATAAADDNVMNMVVAENYVKTAFGIVNDYCGGASTSGKKSVIRVGGTRTPCNDCAKEMGIHTIHWNDDDKDVHFESAYAKMVGNRIVSTMTSSSGKVFSEWKFKKLARKPIDDVKNHDASYNPDQSQDYNELYDTFNSFELSERMYVTENMGEIWFSRLKSYEETTKSCNYNKFLNSLIKLKKDQSLKLKDFFIRHLESLYANDHQNSQALSKQNSKQMVSLPKLEQPPLLDKSVPFLGKSTEQDSSKSVQQSETQKTFEDSMQLPSGFDFLQNDLNDILKKPMSLLERVEFERLVIRRLDLNIQGDIVDEMIPSSGRPDDKLIKEMDDKLIKEMDWLYFKGKQVPVMNQQVDYLDKTQTQLVQLQELLTDVSEISSFEVMKNGDDVRQIVKNLVNGDNGDLEDQGMKEWKNSIKLIDCLQKLVPAQKNQPLLLEIASGILENLPSVLNGVKDTLINLKLTKDPIFLNLNSLKEILEGKTITSFALLKKLFEEYDSCIKDFPKVKKIVEDKLKRQTCTEEPIRTFIKYVTQFNDFISKINKDFRDELNNLKLLTLCVSLLNPELKKIQCSLNDDLKSEEPYMKIRYISYLKAKKDKEKKIEVSGIAAGASSIIKK